MLPPYQKCIALFMSSRNVIGFEIEIRNMRGMCAEYDQRMSKEMEWSEGIPGGLASSEISYEWNHSLAAAAGDPFLTPPSQAQSSPIQSRVENVSETGVCSRRSEDVSHAFCQS